MTYEQLLDEMKTAFFEKCGENPEQFTDIRVRLETVASELFSLYCRGEYVLRQAFPQTATGEALDFHATLRDIHRKAASKARGTLQFYTETAAADAIDIPQGVICSVADKPFLQFITLEDGVIAAGETEVSVAAEALCPGAAYNTAAQTVTVMVNPPLTVTGVRNDGAFAFGSDAESDTHLRKRILSAYSNASIAFTRKAMEEAVCGIEEVQLCHIFYDAGTITVYVKTADGTVSPTLLNEIKSRMPVLELVPCSVRVEHAQAKPMEITVDVTASRLPDEALEGDITAAVRSVTDRAGIGDYIGLSAVTYAVAAVDGVDYCEICSDAGTNGVLRCEANEYPVIQQIRVLLHE